MGASWALVDVALPVERMWPWPWWLMWFWFWGCVLLRLPLLLRLFFGDLECEFVWTVLEGACEAVMERLCDEGVLCMQSSLEEKDDWVIVVAALSSELPLPYTAFINCFDLDLVFKAHCK
jgi:hypothetical protein